MVATSGLNPSVVPTAVTYGQLAGKLGMNFVVFCPSLETQNCLDGLLPATPASPDPKMSETPRAPEQHEDEELIVVNTKGNGERTKLSKVFTNSNSVRGRYRSDNNIDLSPATL